MMRNFRDPQETQAFIEEKFASDPARLAHILKVSGLVRDTAQQLASETLELDANYAYCVALLHDVGYIEEAVKTGFHPKDGFDFLCKAGFPDIAKLIVGHSNSPEQARLREIEGVQADDHIIAKLITYWDVRVKQGGELVSYQERIQEIEHRYGPQHPVTQAHLMAQPRIELLIAEVDEILASST